MAAVTPGPVAVDVEAPLGIITLAAPRRRNPLSTDTMRAIIAALRELGENDEVRVVIVRAEGRPSPPATTWPNCATARWRTNAPYSTPAWS